jgi:iron complex outermembrane recepter protein
MRQFKQSKKSLWVTAAVAAALSGAVPLAYAQEAPATANAIVLKSQPLDEALRALARQANIQIVFEPSVVSGRTAPAITGATSAQQALDALLANTGLAYRSSGPSTFTIVPNAKPVSEPQSQAAPRQSEPAAAAPATESALTEVLVTATRVKRDGFEAPTPTTVLGSEELARTAPQNIADAINQLPTMSIGLNPRTANFGTGLGVGGLNVLNLRNLGNTRTLVLLDGRRIAGSTSSGLVDVNTIPQQLIQRVDIVTGGASAAYGSDAVAGVVNFVLDKDFDGARVDVQMGITDEGDGESRTFTGSFGTPFLDGRAHLLLSAQYSDVDGIFETQSRDWYNGTKVVVSPLPGQPSRIYAPNVNLSTATGGGLILNVPANGPVAGIQFGPGGTPSPFVFGTQSGTANLMIGGERNDIAAFPPLSAALESINVFSRLSYELTPSTTIFLEGSFAKSEVFNPAVHQFKLGNLTILQNNAFLPDSIRAQMAGAGLAQVTFGTWNQDIGKLEVKNDLQTYRGVLGLEHALTDKWQFNAYVEYGRTDALNEIENETITARYNQAIDAIRDPSGSIVCRNPANGCVPLNIIGTGVASREAIDWVTGTVSRDSVFEQSVLAATINGDPFSTWAGPVSMVFGAESRTESVKETVDPLSLTSSYFSGNFKPINGSYSVNEIFTEAVVPLAQSLELNAAVRETNYSTSGAVTTWKVGGTWRPISDILLRGTLSRDIRAPNNADLFASVQATQTVVDPFNGNRADTVAAYLNSGNPDLEPEIADGHTIGIVYTPTWLDGFQASFDYYSIDMKEFITTLAGNVQQAVDLCFAGSDAACSLITRDAAGHISSVRLAGVNAGKLETRGFDLELSYRTDLGNLGQLTFRALISRLDKMYVDTSLSAHEYAGEVAGQSSPFGATPAYFPKTRGTASISYGNGGLNAGLGVRYIGPGVIDNTFPSATLNRPEVSSVTYLDGTMSYQFEQLSGSPQIYFAVDNLLNEDPPVVSNLGTLTFLSSGTSVGFYDGIGRAYRAGFRLKF